MERRVGGERGARLGRTGAVRAALRAMALVLAAMPFGCGGPELVETPRDPRIPATLFREAEAMRAAGDLYGAQERYRQVALEYEFFEDLTTVLARLREVGLAYLEGRATAPFLWLFSASDTDLGVEILEELVRHFEEQGFDELSFEIAEHRFREGDYEAAVEHYLRVEESYPDSIWVGSSMVKRALCHERLSRGHLYDPRDLAKSEELLVEYLRRGQHGERVAEARAALDRVRGERARLDLDCAVFYLDREDSPRAALIYVEAVLRSGVADAKREECRALLTAIAEGEDLAAAESAATWLRRLDAIPPAGEPKEAPAATPSGGQG